MTGLFCVYLLDLQMMSMHESQKNWDLSIGLGISLLCVFGLSEPQIPPFEKWSKTT